MRRRGNWLYAAAFAAVWYTTTALSAVTWSATTPPGGLYQNVDITIDGSLGPIIPTSAINLLADAQTVTITVINDPVIISSYPWYLTVKNNNQIVMDLSSQSDLTLSGNTTDRFLIFYNEDQTSASLNTGGFDIVLGDGSEFVLTKAAGQTYGAWLAVALQQGQGFRFVRSNTASNANCELTIGADSLITGVVDAAHLPPEQSSPVSSQLIFSPENSLANTGRMILRIQDDGALLLAGHRLLVGYEDNPTIAAIDLSDDVSDLVYCTFDLAIKNHTHAHGSQWASLLLINQCTQLTPLFANPFQDPTPVARRYGFVLCDGSIVIEDGAYLDYVAASLNQTPTPVIPDALLQGRMVSSVVKDRNPSALVVDSVSSSLVKPMIICNGTSALYFRAGAYSNAEGETVVDEANGFIIPPAYQSSGVQGYGQTVFDVEGPLEITKSGISAYSAVQLLSLQVAPTGGSVFIDQSSTLFPLRTFATDEVGKYLQYNKGNFLINAPLVFLGTHLQHTDELGRVYPRNYPAQSDATYLGGEGLLLDGDGNPIKPYMAFIGSSLDMHTSGALAGIDIFVPEYTDSFLGNTSAITFFSNGYQADQGIGRSLIMGTVIGGCASDLNTIINDNAHLDVIQQGESAEDNTVQTLQLSSAWNNSKITQGLPSSSAALAGQYSAHTLFMAHNSNISIGRNEDVSPFTYSTQPALDLAGTFISIQSEGGDIREPELSMATGVGGLFVDLNGTFQVLPSARRAHLGIMVSKSRNGVLIVPTRSVLFDDGFAIAHSSLDMSDANQQVIVGPDDILSDYSLDWSAVTKDYTAFTPYEPAVTPSLCGQATVTTANISALPTIQGAIGQLQLKQAQLGNRPHVMIDGGRIQELIMLNGEEPGVDQTAVLVLQNNARVGLGSANRNRDSNDANIILGVNGITLIANGNAEIILNDDITAENVCSILQGPDFVAGQQLKITSMVPREFRIKQGCALDLTQFTAGELLITGFVNLVFEPGSLLLLGNGEEATTVHFTHQAILTAEPVYADLPTGTSVASTDSFRTKFVGNGHIALDDAAVFTIARNALVGIESGPVDESLLTKTIKRHGGHLPFMLPDVHDQLYAGLPNFEEPICAVDTAITLSLSKSAQLQIGSSSMYGGCLQVGNTSDKETSVNFTLTVNGPDAQVYLGSQALLGLGAGVVNKPQVAPNNWLIGNLYNVANITLNLVDGSMSHRCAFTGADERASLLALGQFTGLTIDYYQVDFRLLGGGNMVQINSDSIAPVVATTDGIVSEALSAGVISSSSLLIDPSRAATFFAENATPTQAFQTLKINDYTQQVTKRATIFEELLGTSSITYVYNGTITRVPGITIRGSQGQYVARECSLNLGAVGISLSASGQVIAYEINN
jgi:hypothetical protein